MEDSADLATQFHTAVNIGDHAFSHMEEDIDKQRLLGGQPSYATADPETASMTSDLQHKQRLVYSPEAVGYWAISLPKVS